jgi:Ca-activated chloride channel homolog
MKHASWMALGAALAFGVSGCSSGAGEAEGSPAGASPATGGTSSSNNPGGLNIGTGDSAEAPYPNASAGTSSTVGYPGASAGGSGTVGMVAPPPVPNDAAGGMAPVASVLPANPFVITEHDPLSTFAADVDTASYDIFTSNVTTGSLPVPSTVRLEEFVNYFHYNYEPPASDAEHPFSISLAAAPALDPSTLFFRVGIRGRLPLEAKRPANLVFLVDTSGSMAAANKLPLVKYTLTEALTVLDPSDKISIVTYAGSTAVELQPTVVADSATIKAAIARLSANGSTNGGMGIQLAYEQARTGFKEGGINHVMLCTDGDFNVGITSPDALVDLITEQRKSGITFTALGYGSNSNDSMMERVSNAGNGTYSVIYGESQARDYVETRLLSNLQYIAKDMKIQVEFNPAKVYAYRLLGYEDRAIADQDFRNDVVDAGEVGAGHRVTALYQLVLAGGELPTASVEVAPQDGAAYSGPTEVPAEDYALVKVRYKQPDATEQDPASEVNRTLASADIAQAWGQLDADFQWAYAVGAFSEILKHSPYATPNQLNTIANIINQPVHDGIAERQQFRDSFAKARALLPP